jgi:hypothetical protein
MEKLEARIRRDVRLVTLALALLIGLAVGCQLDIALNKNSCAPNPLLMGAGLVPGLLIGLLALAFLKPRLVRPSLRLVSPFWVGMLAAPVAVSGLVFWQRADVPMDWRPVVAAGLIATLPGALLGWLVAWLASKGIRKLEAPAIISQAAIRLSQDIQMVQQVFPGAVGQLHRTGETYLALLRIPRQREVMVFYVECGEEYPQFPPRTIGLELEVLNSGQTERIGYTAPILGFWNPHYSLVDIVNEALYLTKH